EVLTGWMYLVGCASNFCWGHDSLRIAATPTEGSKWRERTPAMAAGLTDHRWTMRELLSYPIRLPRWVPPKRRGRPPKRIQAPVPAPAGSRFPGVLPAASFDSENADPLNRIQWAWSAASQGLFTLRDRASLTADLGQSQSGNSSLSPQACRVETRQPNWPYGRLDRSPLPMPLETTVGAPLRARRF